MKALRLGFGALIVAGSMALAGCPAKDKGGGATAPKHDVKPATPASQPAGGGGTATGTKAAGEKPAGTP